MQGYNGWANWASDSYRGMLLSGSEMIVVCIRNLACDVARLQRLGKLETWNVALWIGNDCGLYELACDVGGTYGHLVSMIQECSKETPDGCKWDDVNINGIEVNEMMKELID